MEKPILFKGEMVKKILSGEKTQTRRIINGPMNQMHYGKLLGDWALSSFVGLEDGILEFKIQTDVDDCATCKIKCPYSKVGGALWVRETWWQCINNNDRIYYAASETPTETKNRSYRKRPSIFLKRSDSRINLEIISIRVERLQNITASDAIAEGIDRSGITWKDYRTGGMKQAMLQDPVDSFRTLWNTINKKRGYGWDINPWLWVIKFKVI